MGNLVFQRIFFCCCNVRFLWHLFQKLPFVSSQLKPWRHRKLSYLSICTRRFCAPQHYGQDISFLCCQTIHWILQFTYFARSPIKLSVMIILVTWAPVTSNPKIYCTPVSERSKPVSSLVWKKIYEYLHARTHARLYKQPTVFPTIRIIHFCYPM